MAILSLLYILFIHVKPSLLRASAPPREDLQDQTQSGTDTDSDAERTKNISVFRVFRG